MTNCPHASPCARQRRFRYLTRMSFLTEVTPLTVWPDVECRSIVCRDDRAINPVWVRSSARQRLGVEAIEIGGGHSPFLTRPAELARLLNTMV